MKRIKRTINTGLAMALLIMLLTFGGMTVTNNGLTGGVATLLPPIQVASQQVATSNTVVTSGDNLDAQNTAAITAQQGVIDARYAVHQAGSAVVTVVNTMQVTTRGRYGQTRTAEALGSGVIIDSRGYIVTNQHVVANQQSLQVIFADGTKVEATLVGEDASMDIAILKVEAKVPAVAQLGDSDKLDLGQPVVAIGTALGDFANTVTVGIVSGLHRQLDDASTSIRDLVQTDAAINHGNSGGPLLDLNGNVIGINTAVVRNDGTMGSVAEGLGFAIPSNTVKSVVERLTGGL